MKYHPSSSCAKNVMPVNKIKTGAAQLPIIIGISCPILNALKKPERKKAIKPNPIPPMIMGVRPEVLCVLNAMAAAMKTMEINMSGCASKD